MVKNFRIYFVKKQQQRGKEAGHKIGKMGQRHLWMASNGNSPFTDHITKMGVVHAFEHYLVSAHHSKDLLYPILFI